MDNRIARLVALILVTTAACGGGSSTSPPPDMESQDEGQVQTAEIVDPPPAPVSPIPEGYHTITPMLAVTDVAAAIAFYQAAFGAEQTELAVDPDSGAALHAEIRIGDSIVMLTPENDHGARAPSNAGGTCGALYLYVEDVDAAFARAKEAGATEVMAVTDMFWGDRYGALQDPSGHRWGLATHKEEVTPEQMAERGAAFAAAMARRRRPPRFTPGTPATSYRPEGYFTVTPNLVVSGPADVDALVRAFGATEQGRMVDPRGNLAHADIRIGDSHLMLTGETEREAHLKTPEHLAGATPVFLMLYVEDVDSTFGAAVAGGATQVEAVTDMFWGDRFGLVRAASGHSIGIATHVADVTPEEMQRRMRSHQ